MNCTNMTMAEFATQFHDMAGGYVNHPIVDLTGLKGAYDFTIKCTDRGRLRMQQSGPSTEVNSGDWQRRIQDVNC